MPSLGDAFRVKATITDITGVPLLAPDSQLVSLFHADGTLHASSVVPANDGGGVFHQDFVILTTDVIGVWLITWSATHDGITKVAKKHIFVDDPP